MSEKQLKIGIIGAGKTGKYLIEQLKGFDFVNIVIVADIREDAPGLVFAKENGLLVTTEYMDVARLGKGVDLIIEVTGQKDVKLGLRSYMQENGNKHTVIVPELVAVLMMSMAKGELVDSFHGFQRYE
ncbi:MAG TPA: oxidoreductase [Desulfobacteria bacterium]|nr:oxidoreductase [Desulfobacteria bacterium]